MEKVDERVTGHRFHDGSELTAADVAFSLERPLAITGTVNFPPPTNATADHIIFRGTRLPYVKFPRNPGL